MKAWYDLLRLIFPYVRDARVQSARESFDFFRSEHRRIYGYEEPEGFSDDSYRFEWFVKDMDSARKSFTDGDADAAIVKIQLSVARVVENAGREAIQYAVDKDDEPEPEEDEKPPEKEERRSNADEARRALEPIDGEVPDSAPRPKKKTKRRKRKVKGWARVPTGAETCGWCLMLCSRGPVFHSAYSAGLEQEDYLAVQMFEFQGEFDSDDMEEWHPGCDCKAVPVFDLQDWPGRDQYLESQELWKEATKLAREELEKNPDKKSFVNGQWVKTTLNREAINQMRRLVGEYDRKTKRSSRAA